MATAKSKTAALRVPADEKVISDIIADVELREEILGRIDLLLVGTAPLIVNNWSHKALEALRGQQRKLPKAPRSAKDPEAEFNAARYRMADGQDAVPANGLKGAFVAGARFIGGSKELNMTVLRGALRVQADEPRTNLMRLYAPDPVMREDKVRVGAGMAKTVDLRYRPEYWPWFLKVHVTFPATMFTGDQIVDLIKAAGTFNGFCEWRPGSPISVTGSYGTFTVGNAQDERDFEAAYKVKIHA